MAKKEKVPNEGKAQKPLYKKWWFWVIAVSLVGAVFTGLFGDGETAEPDASQPPAQTATQPETSEPEGGDPADSTPEPDASTPAPADTAPEPSENAGGGTVADGYSVPLGAGYVTIQKHPVLSGSNSYIFDIGVGETTTDVMASISSDDLALFIQSLDFETYGYNNIVLSFEDGTGINFMKGSASFMADYGYLDVTPGNFTMVETLGSIWNEGNGWYYMTVEEMEAEDAAG